MDFPKHLYHPDGRTFWCPSEEFHESLLDGPEWSDQPFTGPRKPEPVKCRSCALLAKQLAEAKLALVDRDLLIERLSQTLETATPPKPKPRRKPGPKPKAAE